MLEYFVLFFSTLVLPNVQISSCNPPGEFQGETLGLMSMEGGTLMNLDNNTTQSLPPL